VEEINKGGRGEGRERNCIKKRKAGDVEKRYVKRLPRRKWERNMGRTSNEGEKKVLEKTKKRECGMRIFRKKPHRKETGWRKEGE
jgi:hypothetical protein